MIQTIWCTECDEFIKVELADKTKYAVRIAEQFHADQSHNGNAHLVRREIGLNEPMSDAEMKHLKEFCEKKGI